MLALELVLGRPVLTTSREYAGVKGGFSVCLISIQNFYQISPKPVFKWKILSTFWHRYFYLPLIQVIVLVCLFVCCLSVQTTIT